MYSDTPVMVDGLLRCLMRPASQVARYERASDASMRSRTAPVVCIIVSNPEKSSMTRFHSGSGMPSSVAATLYAAAKYHAFRLEFPLRENSSCLCLSISSEAGSIASDT